jgi:AcrR family transcriptional regulator
VVQADGESLRERAARYSPAQLRTIDAALALFAEHGVGGTSLQMIADAVGVTKAAIYHQFSTKEAIVLGVIDVKVQPLEDAIERAESAALSRRAREEMLARVIEVVVSNRRALGALQNDPVLFRLLGEHEPSRRLWARLYSDLLGDDLDASARVRAAVLSSAIGSAAHPFVADLDDETLCAELLQVGLLLIDPPG